MFPRRAISPMWPNCCMTLMRNRQRLPSSSMVWAKSTPPSSWKTRFRRSSMLIMGKISRAISSSLTASRFSGRNVPLMRTNGGEPTFKCRWLAVELDDGPKELLDFEFLLLAQEPLLIEFGGRHCRELAPCDKLPIADRHTC